MSQGAELDNSVWAWAYSPVNERFLSALAQQSLWFSALSDLADSFDTQVDIRPYIDHVLNLPVYKGKDVELYERKVAAIAEAKEIFDSLYPVLDEMLKTQIAFLSMSREWSNTLNWFHHGQNHSGIALGFSANPVSSIAIEVSYDDAPHLISAHVDRYADKVAWLLENNSGEDWAKKMTVLFDKSPLLHISEKTVENVLVSDLCLNALTIKHSCWKYEQEIRLFETPPTSDALGSGFARAFDPELLNHVMFGINCTQEHIERVTTILSSEDTNHVQFWQAKKDHRSLRIVPELL